MNILNLHKLRQEVLVKEKLAAVGRSSKLIQQRGMRKFASTPNLLNMSMNNLSSLDLSASPTQGKKMMGSARRLPPRSASRQSTCVDQLKNKNLSTGLYNEFLS